MYRVLVVDDEAFITDSLAFMLENRQEPELEVVKAYSAPEAIELLNRTAFHIVVTDVEMPGKTGIELLKEINNKWPSCQVVFLTGHDNFQYAHQAMRYNVVRYVLKNEGDDVLIEAIEECIRRIEKEQLKADILIKNNPVKRNHKFINQHIKTLQAAENLLEEWQKANIKLSPEKNVMLLAGCTRDAINEDTMDALHSIVTTQIGHAVDSEVILASERLCVWFMQPAEGSNRAHALAAIKSLAEGIRETILNSMSVQVTFVFSDNEVAWNDVTNRIERFKEIAQNHLENYQGLALIDDRFFDEQNGEHNDTVAGAAFVGHVLSYIKSNLGSDLSLTALSEQVYLNPSYLSRRFKEVTGKNIKDTILELRMEEACRLLKDSTNRIKNIAGLLGYESAAHFSRIFKKEMSITPQEYRDG